MSSKEKETKFLLREREASPPAYPEEATVKHFKPRYAGYPPGDQLYMSVFTVFCCFMPFGIIALIKSIEARTAYQLGRQEEAAIAIRSARTFNRWSIIVNVILLIVGVAVWFGLIFYTINVINAKKTTDDSGY